MVQAGDLGRSGWKEADVERWVTAWGGVFAGDLSSRNNNNNNHHHDADITHILATQAQFKDKKNARVARARKMRGKDAPHFVTADWLEDSISARRRLPEREFSLRERQRKEDVKRRRAERAEKGIEKGKRLVNDCKSLSSLCLSFLFLFLSSVFCFFVVYDLPTLQRGALAISPYSALVAPFYCGDVVVAVLGVMGLLTWTMGAWPHGQVSTMSTVTAPSSATT